MNEGAVLWSRDPPENLKLHVRVRAKRAVGCEEEPIAEGIIKWQQKIFSSSETQLIQTQPNSHPLAEEFIRQQKEEVVDSGQLSSEGKKIILFTVVAGEQKQTKDDSSESKQQSSVDRWKSVPKYESIESNEPMAQFKVCPQGIPHRHLVGTDGDEEEKESIMWIMAEIAITDINATAKTEQSKKESKPLEVSICRISRRQPGLYQVWPGLSNADRPWFTFTCGGETYEYEVVLEGTQQKGQRNEESEVLAREVKRENRKHNTSAQGLRFQPSSQPPQGRGALRLFVFGQIDRIEGFDAPSVYTEHCADIPDGWTSPLGNGNKMIASQAVSNVSCGTWEAVNQPFEFQADLEPGEDSRQWPCLHFVVHSLGSWQRHDVLGYGHAWIPKKSGSVVIEIPIWRPLQSVRDQMRSFFIGGSPELTDFSFESLPPKPRSTTKSVSKLGNKTEVIGHIIIKMNCMIQTPPKQLSVIQRLAMNSGKHSTRHATVGTSKSQPTSTMEENQIEEPPTTEAEAEAAVAAALERVRRRVESIQKEREQKVSATQQSTLKT